MIWNDAKRLKRIQQIIQDIRHDLGLVERLLSHLEASKAATGTLPLDIDDPPHGGA